MIPPRKVIICNLWLPPHDVMSAYTYIVVPNVLFHKPPSNQTVNQIWYITNANMEIYRYTSLTVIPRQET
jgi:hypothetical protein